MADTAQPQQPQTNPNRPDSAKQFELKQIEQQMLQFFQDQYFAALSNFLSFLCLERLNYPVTQATKFEVQEGKLFVWEGEQPPEAGKPVAAEGAPTQPTEPSVATAADSTADALKDKDNATSAAKA